jgi:hypothetical protein
MGRLYSILEEMRNFHNILREQGLTIDTCMPIRIEDSVYGGGGGGMCNVPRSFPEL